MSQANLTLRRLFALRPYIALARRSYATTITTTTSSNPADENDDERAGIPQSVTTTIQIEHDLSQAPLKTKATTTIEPLFSNTEEVPEGVAPVKITTEIVSEQFEPMVMQDFDLNGTKFPGP
jgi:hypothetical protein